MTAFLSMDGEKPFLEHLEELRGVLLRSLFAVTIALPVAFYLAGRLLPLLPRILAKLGGRELKFHYFTPLEPFIIQLKLSLLFAFLLALPFIAFQVGRFVSPALYDREKRLFGTAVGTMTVLFFGGSAFAFFVILPLLLNFSYGYESAELTPIIGLSNFVGLAAMMMLGFGLMFQFPIVILILVKLGLVLPGTLRRLRPMIIIGILVLSAILTPPDVISQLLMAIPTWLLFEGALLLADRMKPAPGDSETTPEPVSPTASTTVQTTEAIHDPYRKAARKRRQVRPIRKR